MGGVDLPLAGGRELTMTVDRRSFIAAAATTVIAPNAVINERTLIGDDCFVGAGVVIGSWLVRMWLHAIVLEPGIHTGLLEATQRRWIPSRLDQFVLGALAARAYVALARNERAAALAPYVLAGGVPALVIA